MMSLVRMLVAFRKAYRHTQYADKQMVVVD
jgi:hypothetical protein